MLVTPSLGKQPIKVPKLKPLRLFFAPFAWACLRIYIKMYSIERRRIYACTFQPRNFAGCGSEGVRLIYVLCEHSGHWGVRDKHTVLRAYSSVLLLRAYLSTVPWSNKMFCRDSYLMGCLVLLNTMVTSANYYGQKLQVLDGSVMGSAEKCQWSSALGMCSLMGKFEPHIAVRMHCLVCCGTSWQRVRGQLRDFTEFSCVKVMVAVLGFPF